MTTIGLAACAGVPEPLWDATLPNENEVEQNARHTRALAFCRICPARVACAATIDLKHDDGVRGGILLPTIHDSDRRSWQTYEEGRSGFGDLISTPRPMHVTAA